MSPSMPTLIRFGDFEFDPVSGELTRRGRRVPLQPQPARVLARLAGRAGEVVTRDEIRDLLWGASHHVDYEQGINFCIRQLRGALGDSAEHPVYIETLPRRGYRFRPPTRRDEPASPAAPEPQLPAPRPAADPSGHEATAARPAKRRARNRRFAPLAAAAAALLAGWIAGSAGFDRPSVGPRRPTMSAAAQEAFARGLYFARRDGRELVSRGLGELRQAVVLAPRAPEPLTALAEALLAMHRYSPSPALLEEAELVSERAVTLAPEVAAAHLARARERLLGGYDWAAAEKHFRRSLELDPNLADAHRGFAALLAASGRLDEAVDAAQRARELDPVCLAASSDLGWYLFLARRYDESIAASRAALALDSANTSAHLNIIYAQLLKGNDAAALEQANAHLAAYFDRLGRPAPRAPSLTAYWRGFVEHLSAPDSQAAASDLALPRLRLGEGGEAMRLLLRGCREHSGRDALFAAVNPLFAELQDDPRLREIVACVGLDPSSVLPPESGRPPSVPLHGIGTVRG